MKKYSHRFAVIAISAFLITALLPFSMLSYLHEGGSLAGHAYAEEARKVIRGSLFADGSMNKWCYDNSGAEYGWSKVSGSGEVREPDDGALVDSNGVNFIAVSSGEITLEFTASREGNVDRIERTYNIVEPESTYRLDDPNSTADGIDFSKKEFKVGSEIDIAVLTWADDEIGSEYGDLKYPDKADFSWTQTGSGSVKAISGTRQSWWYGRLIYSFEGVKNGDVTLTFSSNDGKWSESVSFRVYLDDDTLTTLPSVSVYGRKALQKSYNGQDIEFKLSDVYDGSYDPDGKFRKAKNNKKVSLSDYIKVTSSDKSIAVPGIPYWYKTDDWNEGMEMECTLPMTLIKTGKVVISFTDAKYGEKISKDLTLNITDNSLRANWFGSCDYDYAGYGDTSMKVYGKKGSADYTATVIIGGQTWKKAIPSSGTAVFSIPVMKTGTKGKVIFSRKGTNLTATRDFSIDDRCMIKIGKVKRSSKKIKITVLDAVKGDKIKIKVGKKTYTKKVSNNKGKLVITQKIRKQKKGTAIKVTLYNKFKQKRGTKTKKVV